MTSHIAHNRKLPADDVIRREYYDDGLTITEIARRYGVTHNALHAHFAYRGWPKRDKPAAIETPKPTLVETPEKILLRRQGVMPGRGNAIVEFAISLPRIPTLHGHFAASLPSAAGA